MAEEPAATARTVAEVLGVLAGTTIADLEVEWEDGSIHVEREPTFGAPLAIVPSDIAELRAGPLVVTSANVGIFYRDAERELAAIGDLIEPGALLGEVETLNIRNRVTAPAGGVLRSILAADRTAVEYGQPLAEIDITTENPA
ncbi:MAG: acetyl-CoA carboxylase biotin carboxyl carrier protein [Chloroflexota bacterium]|nr:acetyl-CoA carboxylase biotin carboxyl carrier protein [Chloroflexota bacterium]